MTEYTQPVEPAASSWFRPHTTHSAISDLALLVTSDEKRYLITLQPNQQLHTHQGIYLHDELIGRPWGDEVRSQLGQSALLLVPGLGDLMTHLRRGTQIIYPKDAAYLVHRLSLRAGCRVIEAGTGSGGLTVALAWAVAPTGVVYTYESRVDNYQLAQRNLERVGLRPYVQNFHGTVEEGFQQKEVDALVLDLREPWRFLEQVRASLRPGGFFASLLPTTNQVSELIYALEREHFMDIGVDEILLRSYKPVPDRLRPYDTMAAHTGYLIFARPLAKTIDATLWHAKERQRYRARKQFEAEVAAEAERRQAEGNPDGRKYPRLPLPG
ncbi:MAG: tRNA (adenine-N1)-methyltransferase [Caldilineaceae bacterium]|nr:tRNA (adenine-N1)-methyltransferase [Caldilineaceae bacterium]